ncbi:MAG: DUF1573 domain-containing protein [Flavobacteriales bacterium]|nr:DUF1573 domain-containing protein [Flavobacteriales bacterium]
MRIIALIILKTLLFAGFSFAQSAEFKFEDDVYKFGKVSEDSLLSFDYHFINSGDAPLIIQDIKVTCGCTVPTWPKAPIPPGGKGTIRVTFDTSGKIAYQERTLEVHSNARKSPYKLKFKGTVLNKKKG